MWQLAAGHGRASAPVGPLLLCCQDPLILDRATSQSEADLCVLGGRQGRKHVFAAFLSGLEEQVRTKTSVSDCPCIRTARASHTIWNLSTARVPVREEGTQEERVGWLVTYSLTLEFSTCLP